ncbi:hypothetical protein [Paenibacillus agricola]|uniref:Uncharacterized protein n=1 Tax=Paenibacillus agricola TaxID=2716264 RepID=A0ABX0JAW9_9BACL|nr:hypothetical protein [Paenibacillus agricola]NHN33554.1 hypothetical protein [Paenibacillus agricola]
MKQKLAYELKKLRGLKKAAITWEKSKFAKDDHEFLKKTTYFKKQIPVRNGDWAGLSDVQLENRITELVDEYAVLEAWADRLYKAWDERVAKAWLDELTQGSEDPSEMAGQREAILPDPPAAVQKQETVVKPGRGGSRLGAGRKSLGKTVKVSIALPDEDWAYIEKEIQNGTYGSLADYFRSLHNGAKGTLT